MSETPKRQIDTLMIEVEQLATNLDALKDLSRKLSMLLEEPEPGFVMWQLALLGVLREIAKFVVDL